MADINFARVLGIHSVAAAIIFVVLWVPLLFVFLIKTIRGWTFTRIVLTLFCQGMLCEAHI
jgi:hypothetical protein